MNNVKALTLTGNQIPERLRNIPSPPETLFYRGTSSLEQAIGVPLVAIVGSRKVDAYGAHATKLIASDLASEGVGIISGLALGVDALAHSSALEVGGLTIAVLPSGIDTIYPKTNTALGLKVMNSGGLLSESEGSYQPHEHDFLIRNRLISGLANAVIVTQAAARSGSLNTARHALEQGKTVMAVPGPITNPLCEGPNNLLKMGATPVTCADDVLTALHLTRKIAQRAHELLAQNQAELDIIKTLQDGVSDGEKILQLTKLSVQEFNAHLTMLELRGVIAPLGGNAWVLK